MELREVNELELVKKYTVDKISLNNLAPIFRISKNRMKEILIKHGVEIQKRGKEKSITEDNIDLMINDYVVHMMTMEELSSKYDLPVKKIRKIFQSRDVQKPMFLEKKNDFLNRFTTDKILRFVLKEDNSVYLDIENRNFLRVHNLLKKYNIVKPETTAMERSYFLKHGKYWFEQYFEEPIELEKPETHKCVYCNWETTDIDNSTSGYMGHLLNKHGKNLEDLEKDFPEELMYFKKHRNKLEREELMSNSENYVICAICGEKTQKITQDHLNKHNIYLSDYKLKYGSVISNKIKKQILKAKELAMVSDRKLFHLSRAEMRLQKFLTDNNVEFESNSRRIGGIEFDIIIESHKLCIEHDGLYYHSSEMKGKNYHLNKTLIANKHGYKLIHIFEDELKNKPEIVFNKIKHLVNIKSDIKRIGARELTLKTITDKEEKRLFLDKNHIQSDCQSTVSVGGYHNGVLMALMSFKSLKKGGNSYELNRFATNSEYVIPGAAGKLLNFFIKEYKATKIISFADRRWTVDFKNNLYTKLGFDLVDVVKPSHTYFKNGSSDLNRFHKFNFRKEKLLKKYPDKVNENMTGSEMIKAIGYKSIYDCGLFKYELIV